MAARLKDVAEAAGVSVRTVSNVVNDAPYVRPEMRARVQAVLTELDYRPNLAARHLRRGRTGMITLAVPDLTVPYFAELATHVLSAAEDNGLTLLIEHTDGEREREMMFARGPQSQAVDGLILSPLAATSDDLPTGPTSQPLVLLGERIFDSRFDHVAIDNVAASKAATLHLAANGRRRVAAIGVNSATTSTMADLRLRGYQQAVKSAKLSRDKRLTVSTSWFNRRDGYDATQQLIASGAAPDAIFCFTDLLAHGALRALADLGLRVPQDVAVIGIDDAEESKYSSPSLTSIAPDKVEIARRAVALLVSRIEKDTSKDRGDYVPQFSMSVRESAP